MAKQENCWTGDCRHNCKKRELPDKLRLVDGELVMIDGSDVREYLRQWAIEAKVTANTPINVMARKVVESYQLKAQILEHLAS